MSSPKITSRFAWFVFSNMLIMFNCSSCYWVILSGCGISWCVPHSIPSYYNVCITLTRWLFIYGSTLIQSLLRGRYISTDCSGHLLIHSILFDVEYIRFSITIPSCVTSHHCLISGFFSWSHSNLALMEMMLAHLTHMLSHLIVHRMHHHGTIGLSVEIFLFAFATHLGLSMGINQFVFNKNNHYFLFHIILMLIAFCLLWSFIQMIKCLVPSIFYVIVNWSTSFIFINNRWSKLLHVLICSSSVTLFLSFFFNLF